MPSFKGMARLANTLLGLWLFFSTFAWPHGGPSGFNVWTSGLFIAMFSLCAFWAEKLRYTTAVLAGWFVLSQAFIFDGDPIATLIHDLVVGLAIFGLSMVPSRPRLVIPSKPADEVGFLA